MNADRAFGAWRRSSYSGGSGNCVEVARDLPAAVGVRDSKDPGGAALLFAPDIWRAFVARVKTGEYGVEDTDRDGARQRLR
jgi:Domain of unknown function (DUF397)